ncbi:MAG: NAD-dependent epimerase/dehydratase family protein [Desulfobacterales bacterium]|nr:MAG: NAD-dependent epimerase/dehydratase family protein [Desulfobacterales bacterium]
MTDHYFYNAPFKTLSSASVGAEANMQPAKRCLIVGGGGFLGSHLVSHLTAKGFKIRVFDRNRLHLEQNLGDVQGLQIIYGDIGNQDKARAGLAGVTDVVYLAGSTVPANSMLDVAFDLTSNALPLIGLMQLLRKAESIRRVIYLSTGGAIYGDSHRPRPIPESHPTRPVSSYGLTKLIGERYLDFFLANTEIRGYVLRPSNAYGERQNLRRPQGAVGHFLQALMADSAIVLYGDVVRDYVYAGDVAEAIRLCIEDTTTAPGSVQTFNVGTGRGVSLTELVERIQNITGKTFNIVRHPGRSFDCRYNVLDCGVIGRLLGWKPRVALEEGIDITWQWIQQTQQRKHCRSMYRHAPSRPARTVDRRVGSKTFGRQDVNNPFLHG